jgi:hypothetical protein
MLGKQIVDFLREPRLVPDLYCVAVFLPDYPTRKSRQSETMLWDLSKIFRSGMPFRVTGELILGTATKPDQ